MTGHVVRVICAILIAVAVFCAPAIADVVDRCESSEASFGRGKFNISRMVGDTVVTFVVTSCPGDMPLKQVVSVPGVANSSAIYAVPFIDKTSRDFLVELWWDDGFEIFLFSERSGFRLEFHAATFNPALFSDRDRDGRWEINLFHVTEFACKRGKIRRGISYAQPVTQIVTRETCSD